MNALITFLNTSPEVTVSAALIILVALCAYFFWYRPAIRSVYKGLCSLTQAIPQEPIGWAETQDSIRTVLKANPNLASSWLETQERVIELSVSGQTKAVMFGSPKDLWNPSELLRRRFNFGLAEALPNILVGVGLLFTFVYLSWALVETTATLTQFSTSAKETEEAISKLLKVAGGKFLTSLAGLFASIIWIIQSKRDIRILDEICHSFLLHLAKVVSPNGGESLMLRHLELNNDSVGLSEEILNESREQTGTFKRFETDLAVTLAGAITKSFTPQMEAMTAKLVSAIDGLSENLGSMNQEAIKQMLEDFSGMLKEVTNSEMAQLQATLSELASKLQGASVTLGEGVTGAAKAIDQAGAQLVTQVDEISKNLATGANNLEIAAGSIKIAMNDLEVTLVEASEIGKKGATFVNEALEKAGNTINHLGSLSGGLNQASEALQSVGGKFADVMDNVEELSREQRNVVSAVREVAPTALDAVERVTGVLDQAAKQTLVVMEQTKHSMESTATALTKTVASITGGITSYTDEVAKLHREMDSQLAKAVGSFDKGVSGLEDVVEELAEVIQSGKRG